MTPCPVCQIPLAYRELCPSPSCPCFGLDARSVEAEVAADRWRSRPSRAQGRAMTGGDLLAVLERDAWLAMERARGDLLEIEFRHEAQP
jgi:hypothetical protein